jgi:hypothetical protein
MFLSALVTTGCGPARLGQDPGILWWTDHESGSFSDWDDGGSHWSIEGASTKIVSRPSPTRSGQYSFESVIASPGAGVQSGAQAVRATGLPSDGYYSAWFYLPQAVTSTTYLVLTKFRSRKNAADTNSITNAWDVDLFTDANGMFLELCDHANSNGLQDHTHVVPVQAWFQIEVHLRAATDDTGEVTVWLNGAQVFEVSLRATMPTSYVEWAVGGVAEVISPTPMTMLIDDVAVSKRRLGPEFPVFSRN